MTLALPAASAATRILGATTTDPATHDAETAHERARAMASHGLRAPPNVSTAATSAQASTPTGTTTTSATTDVIHTTSNHPWLTADHGWLLAGDLQVGEPVRLLDGGMATVVALRALPGVGPMWDLSLDSVHTFAVGDVQAVVHNCGNLDPTKVGQKVASNPDPNNMAPSIPGQDPTYTGQQVNTNSLPAGYTLKPEDTLELPAKNISRGGRLAYLAKQLYGGFQAQDWTYVIETWKKPGAPDIGNHYWRYEPTGDFFHHH